MALLSLCVQAQCSTMAQGLGATADAPQQESGTYSEEPTIQPRAQVPGNYRKGQDLLRNWLKT